ncbi:MAG: hypothetical protein ACK44W_16605 [Planctomycetota bacterium]
MKTAGAPRVGAIPFLSVAVARSRVRKLESMVSRFRVRTSKVVGRLSAECGQQAAIQALALAAKEAVENVGPVEREALLRRIAEAEARLEAIRPLCAVMLRRAATQAPPPDTGAR